MPDLEARFRAVVETAYELGLHKLEVVADKKGGKATRTPLQVDVSAYAYVRRDHAGPGSGAE